MATKIYLFAWQHKGKHGSFIYEWKKGKPSARWIADNCGGLEPYENVIYQRIK